MSDDEVGTITITDSIDCSFHHNLLSTNFCGISSLSLSIKLNVHWRKKTWLTVLIFYHNFLRTNFCLIFLLSLSIKWNVHWRKKNHDNSYQLDQLPQIVSFVLIHKNWCTQLLKKPNPVCPCLHSFWL